MLGVQRLGPVIPRFAEAIQPAEAVTPACHPGGIGREPAGVGAEPGSAGPAPTNRDPSWTERDAWAVLMGVSGVGPGVLGRLLAAFGSGARVLDAAAGEGGADRIGEATNGEVGPAVAARIVEASQHGFRLLDRLRSLGIEVVTIEDEAFPGRLRLVDSPPPLLFVRGDPHALDGEHMVAVVGTRWPTDRGRLIAGWIGQALAHSGACVVSGLAVGIDGAAHAATVAEGGRTVAVLGGGHARLFPAAHARLAEEIVKRGGAVVSELPPDTTPTRGTFPRRNRLVSGMADATIVVEAGRRSGALITAGWALEQGRECFVVPGNLDAPMSAGCLAFLRSYPGQARVISGIPELIEDLGIAAAEELPAGRRTAGAGEGVPAHGATPSSLSGEAGGAAVLATLSPLERAIASRLRDGPATLDELVSAAQATSASALSVLTLLELRGLVRASFGRYIPSGALAAAPTRGA